MNYRWLNYLGGRSAIRWRTRLPEASITSFVWVACGKNPLHVPRKRHRTGRADRHQHTEAAHKNLAPLPHAHQQQNPPQEKTVVSITVDPESPESFMRRPKRRRWVNEKYTRWVKTQPCVRVVVSQPTIPSPDWSRSGRDGNKGSRYFHATAVPGTSQRTSCGSAGVRRKHGSQVDLIFSFS